MHYYERDVISHYFIKILKYKYLEQEAAIFIAGNRYYCIYSAARHFLCLCLSLFPLIMLGNRIEFDAICQFLRLWTKLKGKKSLLLVVGGGNNKTCFEDRQGRSCYSSQHFASSLLLIESPQLTRVIKDGVEKIEDGWQKNTILTTSHMTAFLTHARNAYFACNNSIHRWQKLQYCTLLTCLNCSSKLQFWWLPPPLFPFPLLPMGLLLCCDEGVGGWEGGLGDWDGNGWVVPGKCGGGGSKDEGGVRKPANKDWGELAKMESLCLVKASNAAVGIGGNPANKALAASLSKLFSPEFVDTEGEEVSPARLPNRGWWGKLAAAAARECLMLLLLLLLSLMSSCSPPLMIKSLVSY